jgi:hypothetical protein
MQRLFALRRLTPRTGRAETPCGDRGEASRVLCMVIGCRKPSLERVTQPKYRSVLRNTDIEHHSRSAATS